MTGLRQRALSGMQWAAAGRLLKSGLGIVTLAVISRYLTPAEFGIMALVMFITGFAQIFVDFGLRVALVQRVEVTPRQQNTVFWTNLVMALVMMALTWLFAGWLVRIFDAGHVEPMVQTMSLIFPLIALQVVSVSVLERRFAFDRIAYADMISTAISGIAVIGLVVAGLGIWALVAQQLIMAALSTVLLNRFSGWRPQAEFSWHDLKRLFSYAGFVTMTNVVSFVNGNLDRPIVAGVISAQVLGYLTMSQQLVAAPFRIVVTMAKKVLFPILASFQTDKARMGNAYFDIQHAMVTVMAPALLGVAALSQPLVDVLLGPSWSAAGPIVFLVALQFLPFPISETNQTVLAAVGKAQFQFYWILGASLLSLGALWLAVPYGLEAGILARITVSMMLTPTLAYYTTRQIGVSFLRLLRIITPPFLSALAMFAAIRAMIVWVPMPGAVQLLVGVPLGVVIYTGLMLVVDRRRMMGLWHMLRRRRRK